MKPRSLAFHATDFYGSWGEFAGWDATKQSKFAKRFTAIAEKQTLVGMATGVEVAPFRSHLGPILGDLKSVPRRRFTPLMLCAINVLSQVSALCGNHRHAVAALFEAEEGMGETIEYFNYLKRKGVPWTQVFASVGVGDKSFLPLQAADLLAHESWRHLKEAVRPTGRPMRKSMQRLLKNGGVQIHLLPRDAYDAELLERSGSTYVRIG